MRGIGRDGMGMWLEEDRRVFLGGKKDIFD